MNKVKSLKVIVQWSWFLFILIFDVYFFHIVLSLYHFSFLPPDIPMTPSNGWHLLVQCYSMYKCVWTIYFEYNIMLPVCLVVVQTTCHQRSAWCALSGEDCLSLPLSSTLLSVLLCVLMRTYLAFLHADWCSYMQKIVLTHNYYF